MPIALPLVRRSGFVATALLAAFGAWAAADWYRGAGPAALRQASYVGRQACLECHQQQGAAFAGSDHDRAMEVASPESVLGDFDNAEFTRLGERTRFFRDGDRYMVNAEGPDGENHDYEIKWTFGIDPLQQYMVEFPDGRVQVLRVSWDVRKKEWFYVGPPDAPKERIEPSDPLHWTGLAQNWNTMCAECHSTDYRKNYDLATNTYHSTYFEIDVSCEACHGPGSVHVELARAKSLFWDRNIGYGLTNTLKNASAAKQVDTCAPCHSRRSIVHGDYRAGDNYFDHFDPMLLYASLYHADGQIQDEVYVYGSFTQSKMYHKGVKCTDCHEAHSQELKFAGNRLCAQCHQPGKYDAVGHHRHPDAADGAPETQCVTCHMPTTTYMEIDARRDHSIRIPRPDLTVEIGTPNVCNRCHTKPDEDAAWAAAAVERWYGPQRPDDPHFAPAIAAARQGKPEGERLIAELFKRGDVPDIVRATAVSQLQTYPTPASERLRRDAAEDSSPLVRTAAARAITPDSPARLLQEIAPLLKDPVRSVRMAAAARLVAAAPLLADTAYRTALDKAIAEYRAGQQLHLDRADAHLSLATLDEGVGDIAGAIESFRAAIRVEPYRSGARGELARLLDMVANDPAQAALRVKFAVDREEIRRLRVQEADLLARDAQLLPGDPQPHYRRGLMLFLLGELDAAREAMKEAGRVAPTYYDAWMALALISERQQHWDDADLAIRKMQQLRPEAMDWQVVLRRMAETVRAQRAEDAADAPHSDSLSPEDAAGTPPPDAEP